MPEDKQSRIDALFLSYRESLPGLLAELETSWASLVKEWDEALAAEFDRKVHGIAGSAATFDLAEIGAVARELEETVKPLLDRDRTGDKTSYATASQLLLKLKTMVGADLA